MGSVSFLLCIKHVLSPGLPDPMTHSLSDEESSVSRLLRLRFPASFSFILPIWRESWRKFFFQFVFGWKCNHEGLFALRTGHLPPHRVAVLQLQRGLTFRAMDFDRSRHRASPA